MQLPRECGRCGRFEKYEILLGNADDVFWEHGSDDNMNNSTSMDKRQRELWGGVSVVSPQATPSKLDQALASSTRRRPGVRNRRPAALPCSPYNVSLKYNYFTIL